jgi:hypothetical protein
MHTTKFDIPDYGECRIHHNGDWSGEAILQWTEAFPSQQGRTPIPPETHMVTMPGRLLFALAQAMTKEIIKDQLISFLERMR